MVREDQLVARQGFVRCGACRGIFNALQHLLNPNTALEQSVAAANQSENPPTIMPVVLQPGQPITPAPIADFQKSATSADRKTVFEQMAANQAPQPLYVPEAPTDEGRVEIPAAITPVVVEPVAEEPAPVVSVPIGKLSKGREVSFEIATEDLEAHHERKARRARRAAGEDERGEPEVGNVEDLDLHADNTVGRRKRSKRNEQKAAMESLNWPNKPNKNSLATQLLWGGITLLLTLLLLAQMLLHFQPQLRSQFPGLTPYLDRLCQHVTCDKGPPQTASALSLQGAELQADPSHKGLFIFTASLRNQHANAVAFPILVLSLNGLNNELLVRRQVAPENYVPGQFDLKRGLPGHGEMEFKLFLDAGTINPIGFDVRHTYIKSESK
jgi:Protein of unknown function (DUF3426)